MEEKTITDIINRIALVLSNKRYINMLSLADNNWLEIPTDKVIKSVLNYFESLKNIELYS